MAYQPRRILITGGAGFIGANFIRFLLTQEPQVSIINLDALTYAGCKTNLAQLPNVAPNRVNENYCFIEGNINELDLLHEIFAQYQIDTVIHFAAESHVDRSIHDPDAFIHTNIIGTYHLLTAAKQYWLQNKQWTEAQCRFHHISTDEVYGSLDRSDLPFTETSRYAPNSPYSASKASSDHLVRAFQHTYGLPTTLSNCSNNYGPYQHPEKFLPTVIRATLLQQAIPIYGDGSHIRDWLYVDDHCRGIWQIITQAKTGSVYNIGGDNEQSNMAVAELICELMDQRYPQFAPHRQLLQFVADRPGHDWRYAIDAQKIRSELNWRPQQTFISGLQKTIDYYVATLDR